MKEKKYCKGCDTTKLIAEFGKDREMKDGHYTLCLECTRAELRESNRRRAKLHPTYGIWEGMKNRCHNVHNDDYKYYGGRGIFVCNEWRYSFSTFEKWANENGYQSGLTIDRKDVNGNYEPSNCRWATMAAQRQNRRDSK